MFLPHRDTRSFELSRGFPVMNVAAVRWHQLHVCRSAGQPPPAVASTLLSTRASATLLASRALLPPGSRRQVPVDARAAPFGTVPFARPDSCSGHRCGHRHTHTAARARPQTRRSRSSSFTVRIARLAASRHAAFNRRLGSGARAQSARTCALARTFACIAYGVRRNRAPRARVAFGLPECTLPHGGSTR